MSSTSAAQPYAYALVSGGFERTNGPGIYNRPLYGPHCRDLASFDERILAVVGDSPDALVLLINWRVPGGGGCSAAKLGHLLLGLKTAGGSKWLQDCRTIRSRYVPGHQEYELQDPSFEGSVHLAYVRPVDFEGLLVRVRLPAGLTAENLVFACGGATDFSGGHLDYQGGKGSSKDFHPEECAGTEVKVQHQAFSVRRPFEGHKLALFGAANVPVQLAVGDASALGTPGDLLASRAGAQPMAVGACSGSATEVYLMLRPDAAGPPSPPELGGVWGGRPPAEVFDACCEHYRELSQTVAIRTPDPHLDLGFAAQVLGVDGSWHDPCFTHGPWSWTSPYAGWRICYGPTVLGWHQRVQSSTAEFFADQVKAPEYPSPAWGGQGGYTSGHLSRGAVPDLARNQSYFYNMGEVLVDHILYDWEWTGDLAFMAKAFDFVADKLLWEERCLDPDGDGLYENWLNTWVSDAHWYNGSGCIQASAYNWRANTLMAGIARKLGKDPEVFERRAKRIQAACDRVLWVAPKGVYAEYKDALGRQRLHDAPEQASIYHPIDFRICDDFKSYQMLRYTETAIRNEIGTTPRGGRLVWSSNWLPPLYSSLGLYPQETINLMLCYYRLGLAEKAGALLKGVEASFLMGPCPGGIAHNQKPDGSHFGSTDFTDTTSMFVRTVVEGLFGVQMDVPEGRVTVQPCFPPDWEDASIAAPDIAYDYARDGKVERLRIRTPRALEYRVRLPARSPRVESVTLAGKKVPFALEPGIGRTWVVVKVPPANEAAIEVRCGAAPLPSLECRPVAAIGREYPFRVRGGRILEVQDPQGVLSAIRIEGARGTARVKGEAGWHTFFVLAAAGKARAWLPVDVELRPPLQIVNARLEVADGRARCLCVLRNNSAERVRAAGRLEMAGAAHDFDCKLAPVGDSPELAVEIPDGARLSPGSNLLTATLGDGGKRLSTDVVEWGLAAKLPAAAGTLAKARPVPLAVILNQELRRLHDRKYLAPRPKTYSIMVTENGRSLWDWNARGYCVVDPRLDKLRATGDRFVSDAGVPFAVPSAGMDSCFVSLWEGFPARVTLPVGLRARKLYFLLAASTNPMQSRIENARITVHLAGGQERVLPLVNPDNLDDWLCDPFALSGSVQYLGEKTHALVLDLDLGEEREIERLDLECLSNEVLVGLLGVTVL